MATLQPDQIYDLVKGTLYDLGRLKFQQIAQNLVDYEVFPQWFKKDKLTFDSGIGIQRSLMTKLAGAASHVGPFEPDTANIVDLMESMQIPWRHAQTKWAYGYQETLMNRGEALIFNIIKPRRAGAMIDMVEELENKAWAAPSSSSDLTAPYGLPYWVVKNSSTGFNGTYASGWTTVAGLDLTTQAPNFKNYTAQYTTVNKPDLIKKMRTAHRLVRFVSPVDIDDYRGGKGDRYRLYLNEATMSSVEDVGESQNENLGRDIASMDGMSMAFRGHPLRYVPKLDADTQNPIYMIDHSTFYPVCLKGDYLRESPQRPAPSQHNVFQVFVDLTYNYLCIDRRRNAVLATA